MKKILMGLALVGAMSQASAAAIDVWTTSGPMSLEAGVCTHDFDGATCTGMSYSGAGVFNDSVSGIRAQPVGSSGNYLSAGPGNGGDVQISITGVDANYFGMLAGSLDDFNSITFSLIGGGILSFTGADIAALAGYDADGDQDVSIYWNLRLLDGERYDSIRLSSTSNAFESDNHSIGLVDPPGQVSLPATVALMGLGLVGIGATRGATRRRRG